MATSVEAREQSSWSLPTAVACQWESIPLSTNEVEVHLIELLIDLAITHYVPRKLIYDKTSGSDTLRDRLSLRDTDLISPHRESLFYYKKQDGAKFRRYVQRWKI